MPSTAAVRQHKAAERRTSHELLADLQDPPSAFQKKAARRSSLSPLIIAEAGIGVNPLATGIEQRSVRGGSFRNSDRRLSHQPDFSIDVSAIPPHSGAENIPNSPRASITGNGIVNLLFFLSKQGSGLNMLPILATYSIVSQNIAFRFGPQYFRSASAGTGIT